MRTPTIGRPSVATTQRGTIATQPTLPRWTQSCGMRAVRDSPTSHSDARVHTDGHVRGATRIRHDGAATRSRLSAPRRPSNAPSVS